MARLEVEISGEIKQLEKALDKARKELNQLDKQSVKTGAKIATSGTRAARGIGQIGKSSANAVPAVTEFSRVIQDAPFGIQGVANNITQLTQQFGNLSAKTGGTTSALKLMLSTLSGPAGILLGISAVTSLLVSFGDELFASSKKANELSEALKGISTKSIVEFKVLTNTVMDVNSSFEDQQTALKLLDEKYSDFDTSILKNKSNYDAAKKSIDAYTASLVQQARANAALSKIQEKQSEILSLEEERFAEVKQAEQNLLEAIEDKKFETYRKGVTDRVKLLVKTLKEEYNVEKNAFNQSQKFKDALYDLNSIQDYRNEAGKLAPMFSSIDSAIGDFSKALDTNKGSINDLNEEISDFLKLANVAQKILSQGSVNQGERPLATTLSTGLTSVGINANGGDAGAGEGQGVGAPVLSGALSNFDQFSTEMQQRLLQFNNSVNQIISNNIVNTFAGIGEAIGSALTGAGNLTQNLQKVLLSSVGSLLTQLGKLAIATGVALKAIKKALTSLNPALAIGAGVALVALGSAFSQGASRIGGNIGGGVGGAGGGRSFGGSSGFINRNGLNGNVTFRIAGTDLVGVLQNTIDQNSIFGGSITITSG